MEVTKRRWISRSRGSGPESRWSQIAGRMQEHVEAAGSPSCGTSSATASAREMHEEPKVPNFVSEELLADDIVLAEGMVLAVEPMMNAGTTRSDADERLDGGDAGWQVLGPFRAHDRDRQGRVR